MHAILVSCATPLNQKERLKVWRVRLVLHIYSMVEHTKCAIIILYSLFGDPVILSLSHGYGIT